MDCVALSIRGENHPAGSVLSRTSYLYSVFLHYFVQIKILNAVRFTDGEISWVSGQVSCGCLSVWVCAFSKRYVSGLRRPKKVKFGTNVASVMHTLRFLEKVL